MRRSRGYTLIEVVIVIATSAVVIAGAVALAKPQRLVADIEVTRRNAEQLLLAGQAYYSANRAFPSSVATLVSDGYVGGSVVLPNPLGGAFSITGENVSSVPIIIVRASITRGGTDDEMVPMLNASKVASGGGVEWRRAALTVNSAGRVSSEVYRGMYY